MKTERLSSLDISTENICRKANKTRIESQTCLIQILALMPIEKIS